jgi:hypothetical protein
LGSFRGTRSSRGITSSFLLRSGFLFFLMAPSASPVRDHEARGSHCWHSLRASGSDADAGTQSLQRAPKESQSRRRLGLACARGCLPRGHLSLALN